MRARRGPLVAGVVSIACVAAVVGCGDGVHPTSPAPIEPARSSLNGYFDVAVLIEAAARDTTEADLRCVMDRANAKLQEKTGESLLLTEILSPEGDRYGVALASEYVATRSGPLPEGIVVATHDGLAHSAGGYSQTLPVSSFSNEYPSPALGGSQVYVALVEMTHRYAMCGYDSAGNHISDVSQPGECQNTTGTPCVSTPSGWMCVNSLNDLYSDPYYFVGCLVVHEFLHPFGSLGDGDHWGTRGCRARTGMSEAAGTDRRQSQEYCGICPDLFQAFRRR